MQTMRTMRAMRRLLALAMLLTMGACASLSLDDAEIRVIERHMVAFDALGMPISPKTDINGWVIGDQRMTPIHYRERVRQIMRSAGEFLADGARQPGTSRRRIVLFIHGGLNDYEDSLRRVLTQTSQMMASGDYPIFIAWDSGLFSSYFDDLVRADGSVSGIKVLASPIVLVRDLLAGVLNIPIRAVRWMFDADVSDRERVAASVAQAYAPPPEGEGVAREVAWSERQPLHIDIEELPSFSPSGFTDYYRYSAWSFSALVEPIGLATSFVIDGFGKGAWSGMVRRTKRLFDDEDLEHVGHEAAASGLTLLMQELALLQSQAPSATIGGASARSEAVGLELLRDGLRRLLARVRDPRYEDEVAQLLGMLSSNAVQDLLEFVRALDESGRLPDPARLQQLKQVVSVVVRLMHAGDPAAAARMSDALLAALQRLLEPLRRNPQQRLMIIDMLSAPAVREDQIEAAARMLLDFVEELLDKARDNECQVALLAHSMGTIIGNEILRRSAWFATPRFKDIVYMGAACTIRDYEDSVFPYLSRNKRYLSQFYNLMLHPRAEREEIMGYDMAPRGSLLVYIDNYLTSPDTVRDRTLGRFENIMVSLDRTQRDVADQIHMKVFSVGFPGRGADQPENHGDFTPCRFWERAFYETKWYGELRRKKEKQARFRAST